jgi:hypothetical protein
MQNVVGAVAIPTLGQVRVFAYPETTVLLVGLDLVLVAIPTLDPVDLISVRVVRFSVQCLEGDRGVTRLAVLIAVDGLGQ